MNGFHCIKKYHICIADIYSQLGLASHSPESLHILQSSCSSTHVAGNSSSSSSSSDELSLSNGAAEHSSLMSLAVQTEILSSAAAADAAEADEEKMHTHSSRAATGPVRNRITAMVYMCWVAMVVASGSVKP